MKIGIICPSEIAIRRFMPALEQCKSLSFAGVGVYTKEERFTNEVVGDEVFQESLKQETNKALAFIENYGGSIFHSFMDVVTSSEIDAVYIPLPPALHFRWAKIALEHGKHVLVEKPFTTSVANTKELIRIAEERDLALHENYMFSFHNQLDVIDKIVKSGELGDVRLYRISFGFPMRATNDFRYNKSLGGGALLDAGGYVICYAARLLGPTASIRYAQSNYLDQFEVDMYGSAALTNDKGVTAQIAFGMDNNYKCELEVWGSKGTLITSRVLTAPAGYTPKAIIRKENKDMVIDLPSDDAFLKSIEYFLTCIEDRRIRKERYQMIVRQAELVDEFKRQAKWIV